VTGFPACPRRASPSAWRARFRDDLARAQAMLVPIADDTLMGEGFETSHTPGAAYLAPLRHFAASSSAYPRTERRPDEPRRWHDECLMHGMTRLVRTMALLTVLNTASGCASTTAEDEPTEKARQSYLGSSACETASADTGFNNVFYPQQQSTTPFGIEFDVQPRVEGAPTPIDGVVGLSNGPADAFTDLGPIVRFNPAGRVDARNGGNYMAESELAYRTDWPFYHVRMSVDLGEHTYSAWVNPHGEPAVQIATDYAFRTEQQAVPRLDALASRVDSSGWMQVCDLGAFDSPPSGASRCRQSSGVSGWASEGFPTQSGVFRVQFDLTPLAPSVDAVVGVSHGQASAFRDLAAIVRFNTDGFMDARNGGVYAADQAVAYELGQSYRVTMNVNPATGHYDVTVRALGVDTQLATAYAFRTEQATTTAFDQVGQYVDGDGDINVCDVVVSY
jgi:hypothetical protein